VGSWVAEALARSGVGGLTLVDLDDVCVSNVNRQLHAVEGGIGQPKVDVMTSRIRSINPECNVKPVHAFFKETTVDEILGPGFDYVIDAIDSPSKKALLIASCRERGIPVMVAGAAGGRRDATAVQVNDLARATHDRLLAEVRSLLRSDFGFSRGRGAFGIDCVFSPEPPVYAHQDGSICTKREEGSSLRLDCSSGYGTACFVTGTFGLVAAGHVVQQIAGGESGEVK
jgi:tRNA A37 threonylcarbamoyladenosine dehydratase